VACESRIERIQELVDGTLGAIRLADLEQHLEQCAGCRALKEDLEAVRDAAAALPQMRPPDGAWFPIAGSLRQEGRIRGSAAPRPARRATYAWLGIAAAIVLVAGLSVMMLLRSAPTAPAPESPGTPAPQAAGAAKTDETVVAAQTAVDAAQEQFEKAIADLEKVAKANSNALDPGTSTVIEKNLGIIDRAIAENRAAVKAEPASVAARETLFEALRQKVSLLQDTIALINEMRKGNNAAAAQLVNKS
jgi:anti-sigma factor RsiW